MPKLRFFHRAALAAMTLAAPGRLARLLMRPYPTPLAEPEPWPGDVEGVEFPTAGAALCRGWWVAPSGGGAAACVVLAHGWGSHALRLQTWVPALVQAGYAALLYDARGHGRSDPWELCSIRQFAQDLTAAVDLARSRCRRVAVVGHSLGGAAALLAAADGLAVDAVVSMAAPGHPARATRDLLALEGLPADLVLRRVGPRIQRLVGRDFAALAPENRVRDVQCPVLLLHGADDEYVVPAHWQRIRAAAGPNVEAHLVAGVDHHTIRTDPAVRGRGLAFLARVVPAQAPGGAERAVAPQG